MQAQHIQRTLWLLDINFLVNKFLIILLARSAISTNLLEYRTFTQRTVFLRHQSSLTKRIEEDQRYQYGKNNNCRAKTDYRCQDQSRYLTRIPDTQHDIPQL